jgi:hypothetical protein
VILFRAISAVLDGIWMAFKPALRFIAWLFALVATVALVNDITLWQLSGGAFNALSLADHWQTFSPTSLEAVVEATALTAPWLWNPVLVTVLAAPVWLFFGCLGLALALITRQRDRIQVFAN